MNTDFLPGFAPAAAEVIDEPRVVSPPEPSRQPTTRPAATAGPHRFSSTAFRARQYAQSLPRCQRAAIQGRPRFYSMPHLCRTDDPGSVDDIIPGITSNSIRTPACPNFP